MRILFTLILLFSAINLQAKDVEVFDVELDPVTSDRVILTVRGGEKETAYSLAQVEAIGLKGLKTSTFWPEDYGEYNGVLLRDFLRHAGIDKASQIRVTALDDYTALIPREDWQKWDVLLATRHERKVLPVRKKGPLRIIYPKDIGGEIAASDMRIRWIWAITTIEAIQ